MSYVKFETPEKLQDEIKRLLDTIADTRGSEIRVGMNETTKSIERSTAKLVIIAEDVSPPEIVLHLPILCEEKGIPFGYIGEQSDLGHAVRINVSASAVAVEDAGSSQNERELENIAERLQNLK